MQPVEKPREWPEAYMNLSEVFPDRSEAELLSTYVACSNNDS